MLIPQALTVRGRPICMPITQWQIGESAGRGVDLHGNLLLIGRGGLGGGVGGDEVGEQKKVKFIIILTTSQKGRLNANISVHLTLHVFCYYFVIYPEGL